MYYKTNKALQDKVRAIANEGRKEELIAACNLYQPCVFETQDQAIEFGVNMGWYMGRFLPDDELWRFSLPDHEHIKIYFFGSKEEVEDIINDMLDPDE
jgi:hypothetical protein